MCRHRFPSHDAEPADFSKIGSPEQRTFRVSCPPSFFSPLSRFASQIGSSPVVDLMQPILNLICTLLAKRKPEVLEEKIEVIKPLN
jgi:hypothetical protein